MQINKIQSNNYNNQPNFKGYVGTSMKKYVSSQMERELTRLLVSDSKAGPFANTHLLINRVKALHEQVQNKLSNFMEKLNPNVSMEYELGIVKLRNNKSLKTLSFVPKNLLAGVTGKVYGNTVDMFNPRHVHDSGEITLLHIDTFADAFEEKVLNKSKTINKILHD